MTFSEFRQKYFGQTLDTDASWRAYDIEGHANVRHAKKALKSLGLAYAGELAIPEFCARYGVHMNDAVKLLGCWHLWSLLNSGVRIKARVPRRQPKGG